MTDAQFNYSVVNPQTRSTDLQNVEHYRKDGWEKDGQMTAITEGSVSPLEGGGGRWLSSLVATEAQRFNSACRLRLQPGKAFCIDIMAWSRDDQLFVGRTSKFSREIPVTRSSSNQPRDTSTRVLCAHFQYLQLPVCE